jgi:hypothetical protein
MFILWIAPCANILKDKSINKKPFLPLTLNIKPVFIADTRGFAQILSKPRDACCKSTLPHQHHRYRPRSSHRPHLHPICPRSSSRQVDRVQEIMTATRRNGRLLHQSARHIQNSQLSLSQKFPSPGLGVICSCHPSAISVVPEVKTSSEGVREEQPRASSTTTW